MAEKKNQHYVPQFYFKYFNNKEVFISVLLSSRKIIIAKISVADQSSKAYFYGDAALEEEVCLVENRLRNCLQKVKEGRIIDKSLKASLLEYILYQDARTSKKRTQTMNAFRTMEALSDIHTKSKTIDEAKLWHAENSLSQFSPNEKKWHWQFMLQSLKSVWSMKDLSYVLLRNETTIPYVFSDSPVVFMNPHMSSFADKGALGSMSKGLIVVFPLNPNDCVLFYDSDVYRFTSSHAKYFDKKSSILKISESEIEVVNSLQFLNAENCIYSGNEAALNKLIHLERPASPTEYACAIDNVIDTPNQYTLKFHGTLQQTVIFPDLPFFEYKKSKRFIAARPQAAKEYKKRIEKRNFLLRDKSFLNSLSGMKPENLIDALRL